MHLPHPEAAVVESAKVRDYLLSHEHPIGRFKAVVFEAVGYHREAWHILQADLLAIARLEGAVLSHSSIYGQKFSLSAILRGPSGHELPVVTIWFVRRGEVIPRFVTAYPGGRP
jgi:hypothetical protein